MMSETEKPKERTTTFSLPGSNEPPEAFPPWLAISLVHKVSFGDNLHRHIVCASVKISERDQDMAQYLLDLFFRHGGKSRVFGARLATLAGDVANLFLSTVGKISLVLSLIRANQSRC